MKYGVFISYSHEDAAYVSPIVRLVKALRTDLVFQDTVDIVPGKKWEPQLQSALQEAEVLIIFWCKHAAQSAYVKTEYETAINKGKDILPLLLDDATLAEPLAAYQWIDLRNVIFHKAEVTATALPPQMPPPRTAPAPFPTKRRRKFMAGPIVVAVIVCLALFFFTQTRNRLKSQNGDNQNAAYEHGNTWVLVGLGLVLVAVIFWVVSKYVKRKANSLPATTMRRSLPTPQPEEIIASKLVAALNEKVPRG